MSYDLSFKKGQLWLLGGLVLLGAVLLVVGGYLLGRLAAPPVTVALPVVALPAAAGKKASGEASAASPSVAVVPAVAVPAGGSTGGASVSAGTAVPATRGGYTLQFGAFHDPENAAALAKSLTDKGSKVAVTTMKNSLGESLAVVRFGSYASSDEALHAARVQAALLNTTVVVRPADRM